MTSLKKRKGFALIDLDGQKFQFNWADNPDGPLLIMYDSEGKKYELSSRVWNSVETSQEYLSKPQTWHGKHKKEASWASWGKREVREIWRKYLTTL